MEDFIQFIACALVAVVMVAVVVLFEQWVNITYFDNVPVQCIVNGKKVYDGISAGLNINSSGANTTVTIQGGFMYFKPIAYYVSSDVKVEGKNKKLGR